MVNWSHYSSEGSQYPSVNVPGLKEQLYNGRGLGSVTLSGQ